MNNTAATFFDDIIKTLSIESETAKFANVSPEVLREFYSDVSSDASRGSCGKRDGHGGAPTPGELSDGKSAFDAATVDKDPAMTASRESRTIDPAEIAAMDMNALRAAARACVMCPLHAGRKNVVFGAGDPQADLMFIGEGPGREEDEQGIPFVGEAGQLLTKMINAMQFSRSEVYIANIVKCRPPRNRNPEDGEAASCLPFLRRQIELISPKVIVLLGAVAMKYLLGRTGITRTRGSWLEYHGVKVMPTFHPAYLLRNPSAKREVWEDLQKVMRVFGKTHSPVSRR